MVALNLIDKWLYKHVSRNDLPIKDQNFTILCIEVIYSMKPVPNVKMLVNYCHFPMASVCTMVAHTHWTNYVSIFFFLKIKELLPIYHMTETRQTTCINFENFT